VAPVGWGLVPSADGGSAPHASDLGRPGARNMPCSPTAVAMETLEELGRYRVLEPIGRGGMGTVFAGHHVVLQRPVAIKVLHPHLVAEAAMARRILDEARTIAGLQHPGIVEVLDVGRADDGRTYVVMERLVGESLGDRLQRGRLSEERSVAFARQLASALAVAHAAGVVHRDLKPDNIFIVPDPDIAGGERVKILDFGIAKRIVTDFGEREHTQTGVVLGTPAYMAPEQCTGSNRLDGRADIYALGVVIYLMVTGELPFDGASTEEIFAEHVFCAPRPPAALAPVTAKLAVVIDRCLAKRPEDRFTSMDALALELEILQAETPVRLPSAPPADVAAASPRAETALPTLSRVVSPPLARSARADTEPPRGHWLHGALLTVSAIAVGVVAALVVRAAAGSGEVAASPVAAPLAAPQPVLDADALLVASPALEPRRERRERRAREEVRARRDVADRPGNDEREAASERRKERAGKELRSAKEERRKERIERLERAARGEPVERGERRTTEKTRFADVAPPTLY
jgi:tRNA A-37 threonylcarbamoyl transferase component Bud32